MLRRRGKGEASFLHYKSPGREETGVMNRGRGLRGGERGKERQKRGEEKTEKQEEMWKLRWGKKNRGGHKQRKERRRK